MFKQKGGGVNGFLNNDKKLHFSYPEASPCAHENIKSRHVAFPPTPLVLSSST